MLADGDLPGRLERPRVEEEDLRPSPQRDKECGAVRRDDAGVGLGGKRDRPQSLALREVHDREGLSEHVDSVEAGSVRVDGHSSDEGLLLLVRLGDRERAGRGQPSLLEKELLDRVRRGAGRIEPCAVRAPGEP